MHLAARAASLAERLEGVVAPVANDGNDALALSRLEAWQRATGGDETVFQTRLAWEGLDRESALRRLGTVECVPDKPVPAWTELLEAVTACSEALPPTGDAPRFIRSEKPLPFEDFFRPFLHVAQIRLAAESDRIGGRLAPAAHAKLERSLLWRLCTIGAATLLTEFSLFRHEQHAGFGPWIEAERLVASREIYLRFVAGLRGAGLRAFFEEYAVLARLLSQATLDWIEAQAEMLDRFAADRPTLATTFGLSADAEVIDVAPALSDPHRGGRMVAVLTFAAGTKLVYKPRDLGMEHAFGELLAWMQARHAPRPLRSPRVLNRGSHGWTEFIAPQPCRGAAATREYHRSAGALLCLAYVLDGTDLHFGNLVVHGDTPVAVDLETLFHPYWQTDKLDANASAGGLAMDMLWSSVWRTGLLPRWMHGTDGTQAFDISGLGAGQPSASVDSWLESWSQLNTDRIAYDPKTTETALVARRSETETWPDLPAAERAAAVATGFEETYRFLMGESAALLAANGPLQAFAGRKARLIIRETRLYARALRDAMRPQFLRDGVDFSLRLERLGRPLWMRGERGALTATPPPLWPLWLAERHALERGDVPYLLADADGPAIHLESHQTITLNLGPPAFHRVRTRLRALSEVDLERQLSLIASAYHARDAQPLHAGGGPVCTAVPAAVYDPGAFTVAANAVARQLHVHAVRGPDGSTAWIAPQFLRESSNVHIARLNSGFYDGTLGIVLFLAALYRVTGDTGTRELAVAGLQPLRQQLSHPAGTVDMSAQAGLGGCHGVGAILYGLTKLAHLLALPELLNEARPTLAAITPAALARDQEFDVIGGAAGAMFGLLAFHEATRDPLALAQAQLCAAHLLAGRVPTSTGRRAWSRRKAPPLAGFSHGVAGITLALLRLHRITGERALLDAADEAIAFEREQIRQTVPARARLSTDTATFIADAWCHGPTGIALARLDTLATRDDPETRVEIEDALVRGSGSEMGYRDFLCCGNAGRAELLLTAADVLQRPELRTIAREQFARMLHRAAQTGGFTLHPALPGMMHNPGFFTGTTGIGYMLLRAVAPERLSAVLLWK